MSLIPAAQYVRMSTEQQEHSIENQRAAIKDYAQRQGFEIVRTYEDAGESGLQLKHRDGLRQLLADVVSGEAKFRKIIVLDVSRWGRFQDADEAAHYEFLCKRAGINVIYCAEEFNNEGTVSDYFAKVLKRTSAAEYSRELSIKSFENHKRTVQLGFRVGGEPGYGFRRMAVGCDGRFKGILGTGESKLLMSDRVTLVHGPKTEVDSVRLIFDLCLKRMSCPAIANALNQQGLNKPARKWETWMIEDIVTNPKYAGRYVWNRTTQRLHSREKPNSPEKWIVKDNAFPSIVSLSVFEKAQLRLRRANRWSDEDLLQRLRRLLGRKGYLSERLIQKTAWMPSVATYHRRLGKFERIYELVKFASSPVLFVRSNSRQRTQALRAGLLRQVEVLFPGRMNVFHLPGKSRQILKLDGRVISLLICPRVHRPGRAASWSLIPVPAERQYMTLVCRLNSANDGFQGFHLFRSMEKSKPTTFTGQCPWLSRAERVNGLEALGKIAARVQPIASRAQ